MYNHLYRQFKYFLIYLEEQGVLMAMKEECGVFGISLNERKENVFNNMFLGLFSLQHRGQESCGLAFETDEGIEVMKYKGLVSGKFYENLPQTNVTSLAIGHVRYATTGAGSLVNAQPLLFNSNKGTVAIAHNGNFPQSANLKKELLQKGSIFQTTSDTEILIHLMSLLDGSDFESSLTESLRTLEGAFSMLVTDGEKLIAFRDPRGFRPLSYGIVDGGIVFSSESVALNIIGATNIVDVAPGEMIVVERGEIVKQFLYANSKKKAQCVFELIYFARPDSVMFNESVYNFRLEVGKKLAAKSKIKTDLVLPVPDSGNVAALGFSRASGIPFDLSLMRNHYTGRTFIKPGQKLREDTVKMKLNPVTHLLEGKTLSVVDDSLVRGTTSTKIVKMLRDAGAKEIHLYLASPGVIGSCFYGIHTPTMSELISVQYSPEEIAKKIGADSVTFLGVEDLRECLQSPEDFCYACFTREYPTKITEGSSRGLH